MSKLTTKDAAILSELAYTEKFYDRDISSYRGKSLAEIFFNGDSINTDVLPEFDSSGNINELYEALSNNREYYQSTLSKYKLV
ncbi:hypothetical protein B4919_06425 [Francisella tularensis subsp. novicida]|nr:hypothetical protein [Francisella tularensis]AVC44441.1 hypothetical protein B4919_06425 [Francisella tularensis subsp. novicida]